MISLGKQRKNERATRKSKSRRLAEDCYPVLKAFKSIDEVRTYLSGDRIVCLLCGKEYRKLGVHIQKIHGVTPDQYKEQYGIPWTYGLLCSDSSSLYRDAILERIANGYEPPKKTGEELQEYLKNQRECPRKAEVARSNLGKHAKPRHPLMEGPDGSPETYTARRERLRAKRGTAEFREKMRGRQQCQPEVTRKRLGDYWRGREQTDEHVFRRTGHHKK